MNGGEIWKDMRVGVASVTPGDYRPDTVRAAVRRVAAVLGWHASGGGAFGAVIPDGATVLIKPNWVLHENQAGHGVEALLTHAQLIRTVVEEVLSSGAARVTVGDAPLQACDFEKLIGRTRLGDWAERLTAHDPRFTGIEDFRRTTCVVRDGVRTAYEDLRPESDFVLFDLAEKSLLEPISAGNPEFRVTQYDPRLLAARHRPGRHQYLIARHVLEADVVINLPKLKTHKKAGVTCALKNLIGINGNKEFLPHHRVGGSAQGGDCYQGGGAARRVLERVMDQRNMAQDRRSARAWFAAGRVAARVARALEGSDEIEGAWAGNDTIWRTCLDLNRILQYGRADGHMAEAPQRRMLHIADTITAGQGDGPLAPKPLAVGLIIASGSAPALDHFGARLLRYDPHRIPIVREAFGWFEWPLVDGRSPDDIEAVGDVGPHGMDPATVVADPIAHPAGWAGAVLGTASPGGQATWSG
jgi:uncharacterized protein (DUF362 family)